MDQAKFNNYVETWCNMAKIEVGAWPLAEYLVNVKKNYGTAVAIILQLPWTKEAGKPDYKDYLQQASRALESFCKQYAGQPLKSADLYNWVVKWVGENPEPKE